MLKAGSIVGLGTVALALATPAVADGPGGSRGWYAGLFAGAAWPDDYAQSFAGDTSQNTGFAVGGVVGKRVWESIRAELEISYLDASVDCSGKCVASSIDADALSILGNAWLDIPIGHDVVPYVGGGIGVAEFGLDAGPFEGSDWAFAFQVGAGLRLAIGDRTTVDLGYRWKQTDVDGGDIDPALATMQFDVDAHVAQIGLTFAL